ncbi:hypothetical protein M5689_001781 [Euphorbia peplus]|nr:hypothetical protein M5689_001781 [Euphorbia peplus]
MAAKIGSPSLSCVATALSSNPYKPRRASQLRFSEKPFLQLHYDSQPLRNVKVNLGHLIGCSLRLNKNPARRNVVFATSEDEVKFTEVESDPVEPEEDHSSTPETLSPASSSFSHSQGTDGKTGLISFYNRPYKIEDEIIISNVQKKQSSGLLWLIGPAVLVASFIFPSLYLRRIFSTIFEDSLLTDFLILFFTEALFYCGVAIFLLLIDRIRRPVELQSVANGGTSVAPELGQRISSVASLVLSLIIPLVTMGLVWPWTGPAASATLAPFLVGIVVQFAFEQYARLRRSPSWPVIPIIFQVYRLHQLNRAAQLVTALSFTVRGAEMTSHNLEISSSLNTLLNVLQFLGVICMWSLSSFLMKFYAPAATTSE